MEPINFKQSNLVLTAPKAMPDCGDLPVYADGKQCVSCWKMSLKERIKALFTGRVYLGIVGGRTQPPVWVTSEKPFVEAGFRDEIRAFMCEVKEFVKEVFKAVENEPDKLKHYNAGMIIAAIVCMIAGILYGVHAGVLLGMGVGFVSGFTVGSVAGILKEVYDAKTRKGTPERMDWYATTFGSFIGSSVSSIFVMILLLIFLYLY